MTNAHKRLLQTRTILSELGAKKSKYRLTVMAPLNNAIHKIDVVGYKIGNLLVSHPVFDARASSPSNAYEYKRHIVVKDKDFRVSRTHWQVHLAGTGFRLMHAPVSYLITALALARELDPLLPFLGIDALTTRIADITKSLQTDGDRDRMTATLYRVYVEQCLNHGEFPKVMTGELELCERFGMGVLEKLRVAGVPDSRNLNTMAALNTSAHDNPDSGTRLAMPLMNLLLSRQLATDYPRWRNVFGIPASNPPSRVNVINTIECSKEIISLYPTITTPAYSLPTD